MSHRDTQAQRRQRGPKRLRASMPCLLFVQRPWVFVVLFGVLAGAPTTLPCLAEDHRSLVKPQFTPLELQQRLSPPTANPQPYIARQPIAQQPIRRVSLDEPVQPTTAKPPLRLAPRSEASRQPLARPAPATPGRTLGTVAGSLGLVLGHFLVLAWCLQRTAPKRSQRLPKEAVEILGQAPLTARQQMQLVRVGNKLLLLALSPTGAETLSEITEPTEVEQLLALFRRTQPDSAAATFRQTLTELARDSSATTNNPTGSAAIRSTLRGDR